MMLTIEEDQEAISEKDLEKRVLISLSYISVLDSLCVHFWKEKYKIHKGQGTGCYEDQTKSFSLTFEPRRQT